MINYKRYKVGIYDVDESEDMIVHRLKGVIHNEHGPAIVYKISGTEQYYLFGIQYETKEEWEKASRKQKLEKLLNEND